MGGSWAVLGASGAPVSRSGILGYTSGVTKTYIPTVQRDKDCGRMYYMELLWSAAICTGLFVLFPKAFKYWVGSFVGTAGGIFFWSIGFFVWWWIASLPSWPQMGWSLLGFVIAGNVVGLYCAAKG